MNTAPQKLRGRLLEQLELLLGTVEQYDKGRRVSALHMAVIMRILFHDHLIARVGGKRIRLISTCPQPSDRHSLFYGLVRFTMNDGKQSVEAPLDNEIPDGQYLQVQNVEIKTQGRIIIPRDPGESDPGRVIYLKPHRWWEQIVFIFGPNETLTRAEIALGAANQDVGAHVDQQLDQKYERLVKAGGLNFAFTRSLNDPEPFRFSNVHFAALRQMAYEILSSRELLNLAGDSKN
jgi:hypothetical protein